jgi:pullulanase
MGSAEVVREFLHFIPAENNMVAFRLDGEAVGDTWKTVYVVMNPNRKRQEFVLPKGKYKVVCKNGEINLNGLSATNSGKILVGKQQAMIVVEQI